MSAHGGNTRPPAFSELWQQAMQGADRFGHRQHVHVTWLAVRRFGVQEAIAVISDGIRRTARYAGAPQKYHETVSRAWVDSSGTTRHGAARSQTASTPSLSATPRCSTSAC